MKKTAFLFQLLLLLTSSCDDAGTDVPLSQVYQEYEYEYALAEDVTQARAALREVTEDGVLIELEDPASLEVNGQSPTYNETSPWNYFLTFNGRRNPGTFTYTDADGSAYVNTVNLDNVAPIAFPNGIDTVTSQEDWRLRWEGDPVGPDEQVVLEIITSQDNLYFRVERETGNTDIIVPAEDIRTAGSGEREVRLKRRRRVPLQDTTSVGGHVFLVHSTGTVTLYFQ